MNLPPTAMISHLCPDLDQPVDNPLHGSPNLLTFEVESPEHVEKIVADYTHEEFCLVGLEPMTVGLVSAQISSSAYTAPASSYFLWPIVF